MIFQILDCNENTIMKHREPFPDLNEEPFILKKLVEQNQDFVEFLKKPFSYFSAETNLWINNENGGHLDLIWIYSADLINGNVLKLKMLDYSIEVGETIRASLSPSLSIAEIVYKVLGYCIYKDRLVSMAGDTVSALQGDSLNKTLEFIKNQGTLFF